MQPYLSRPPLQSSQRKAGSFSVPNAATMGRSLYIPQRPGAQPLHMHDFSGAPHGADPRYGHFAGHEQTADPAYSNVTQALFAEPAAPAYQQHTFNAPHVAHAPRHHFPLGPFIIAIIVGVTVFGAWAGYHALSTPDPVNAAPVVYSK